MGTWGAGNFDNDGALDYAGSVIDKFTARIEECFSGEDLADLDEDGETVLMPSVEMICVISERCGAAPPRADVVAGWRERYLRIYDEQIDSLEPADGYTDERRKVIEETFTRLERLALEFWRDG